MARELIDVGLKPGSPHAFRLEFFESTGIARVKLVWDAGVVADEAAAKIQRSRQSRAKERRRDRRGGRRGRRVPRSRVPQAARPAGGADSGGRRDRQAGHRGAHRRQRDHDAPWLDRVGAVLDAWYPGEQGGLAVADVLFGGTIRPAGCRSRFPCPRAAAAPLQPQADRPRRRLRRPHGHGAVPVRIRPELHDVRVFGSADRAGGDRRVRPRDRAMPREQHRHARGRRSRAALHPRRARVRRAAGHGAEGHAPDLISNPAPSRTSRSSLARSISAFSTST